MVNRDALPRIQSQLQRDILCITPPELGCEWLTEAERREKYIHTEDWRVRKHTIRKNQAK